MCTKRCCNIAQEGVLYMSEPLVSIVIPTHNRKDKLIRLIESILKSDYSKFEIIVIDDASTDGTGEEVEREYPFVRIYGNERKKLVSECRNIGIRNSHGDFILVIDDDNVVATDTVKKLVETMLRDEKIGIAGPIMYYYEYPKIIWCAGIKRDNISSLTRQIGENKVDEGLFKGLKESNDFPNAFMISKELTKRVGLFDKKNFPIMYEEADFGERVRRAGYNVVTVYEARVWHDISRRDLGRYYHLQNEIMAYYTGRNRIIFHRRYNKRFQKLVFMTLFLPLFTVYYSIVILFSSLPEKRKIFMSYLKGVVDGLVAKLNYMYGT